MYKYFILLLSSVLIGCKTKQVTTDKITVEQTQDYDYLALIDFIKQNQSTKELTESEIKAFMEAFSALNVQYDGKNIEDKLNVLMQKTEQGTQMTLSGIGKVNYTEETKKLFESLEKRLISRQDSIASVQLDELQSLKNDLYTKIDTKQKQVDNKTFTWQVWLIIGLAVVFGMFLKWISTLFKPRLKTV